MEVFKVLRLPEQMQLIFSENFAKVRLSHITFDTSRSMLQYHEVPSLLHETKLYAPFKTSKQTTFAAISVGTAIASSSRTVANGCGRESGVDRTRPNPQTPKIKWEPFATNPKSRIPISLVFSTFFGYRRRFV